MRQKAKFYPYPILGKGADCYQSSSFETALDAGRDNLHQVKINMKTTLKNPELEELVRQGSVVYVCHVECGQTCYRNLFTTDRAEEDFLIDESKLNGVVEVSSFMMAVCDIPGFTSADFVEDYEGMTFDIEAGLRLGVGSWTKFNLEKNQDDFSDNHSIFSIVLDKKGTVMKPDYSENRIKIMLPEKMFHSYRAMAHDVQYVELMHSVILLPTLTQVLAELKCSQSASGYEDCQWYISLADTYQKNGKEITEALVSCDPCVEAQHLLGDPVMKGLEKLGREDDIDEN